MSDPKRQEGTPVPWEVEGLDAITSEGDRIASTLRSTTSESERRANIRFIAQACNAHNDLLEALQAALEALNLADQDAFDDGKLTRQIRAAIQKARG